MTKLLAISTEPDGERVVPAMPIGLDDDSEVVFRPVAIASASETSAHDWALADFAVLAAGQSAEHEGFDAVCVLDFSDFGVGALRSILSIPVLGAGRSTMLYALTLGARFSILARSESHHRCRKLVTEYGLGPHCASLRTIDLADSSNHNMSFELAMAAVQLCVEKDGAEVICLDASLGRDLSRQRTATFPVPTVHADDLVCKLAESFLGLGLTHSRCAYPEPLVRKPGLIKAMTRGRN